MWRRSGGEERVVEVEAGVSLTIPLGTAFQFKAIGAAPLTFLAITMPPWPGAQEADLVEGPWVATVAAP
jgi:mannose-6-phosphate isomerase-like protein (cupin superfamily)